jgi:hypothetical protein
MTKIKSGCLNDSEKKLLSKLVDEKMQGSALSADELSELTEMRKSAIACVQSSKSSTDEPKKKRKPSKYNIFIGNCMRGGGSNMKTCAVEYKKKKEAGEL